MAPPDGAAGDTFGQSVAVGRDWLAVGSPQPGGLKKDTGAVYLFRPDGQGWTQQVKLQADTPAAGAGFGISVAMDGATLVVGAWHDGPGSAYVYHWDGATWQKQAKLAVGDLSDGANFGCSVAVSGQTIVVGAYSNAETGSGSGSAYVFEQSGGGWGAGTRLVATDHSAGDCFGCSVSIDGGRVAVGARGWHGSGNNTGACYVFDHTATTWSQSAMLLAPDHAVGDRLGQFVAVRGDRVAATSSGDDPAGAVYVFAPGQGGWGQQAKLSAPAGAVEADGFGLSVAFDGADLVVGAPGDSHGGANSGAAYLFTPQGSAWSSPVKLAAQVGVAGARLGSSLAVHEGCIVAGAPEVDGTASKPGAARTFADGVRTVWRTGTTAPPAKAQWNSSACWTAGAPGSTTDATIENGPAAEIASGVSAAVGTLQVGPTAPGRLEVRGGGTLDVGALHLGAQGALAADAGATIRLRGSLDVRATDPAAFDVAAATVCFAPAGAAGLSGLSGSPAVPDLLEAASRDAGPGPAGWVRNFAIGTLVVESGATLRLADAIDNDPSATGPEAVYVNELVLSPGATLDLNGVALYYRNGGPPRRLVRGDTDLDGDVDRVDLAALSQHFGSAGWPGWAGGDSDGDGDVDVADYLALKSAFGLTLGDAGTSPAPTPEPGSAALLAVAAAAAAMIRRLPGRTGRGGERRDE